MYDGWLTFGGMEIINRARTVAYRDALLPTLDLGNCSDCFDLMWALGETGSYSTPTLDEAPWYDPDTPASGEFLGIIPVSMLGFEDSTRTAAIMESNSDGGTIGRTRRATREMRVSGWLLGASQAGCMAGLSWLKNALDGNQCATCDDSDDICFLTACPRAFEEPDDFVRHLRRAKCVAGPAVIDEHAITSCNGYMVQIEFTLVAGSPYVYGEPITVATASGSELTGHIPGAETFPLSIPVETCWAALDKAKNVILRDPDCPPVPAAPTVPALTSACKPLTFSTYAYYPTGTRVAIRNDGTHYNARPYVARGAGVWLAAYSRGNIKNIDASTFIAAKTSTTSGSTWSGEYTLYNEGSATRGLEPAGLVFATGMNKFIMGVSNWDLSTGKFKGEILTSATGLSGSWSVISNLDSTMSKYGMPTYRLSDMEHHDNGSPNGVTYATVFGKRSGDVHTRSVLLRSLDGGVTFAPLHATVSSARSFTYPCIALWPSGEIGLTFNVPEEQGLNWQRSTDGGNTFTPTTWIVGQASGVPNPVVTNDGGVMVMYRDMRNPGPRNLGRHNYFYSKNHGRSWSPGSNLFTGNSAYGQMGADWAVGSTGDLGIVYALDLSNTDARVYWTTERQVENYLSYAIAVPDTALKAWADGVMLLQIRTGAKATRQMRVRLIPRPLPDLTPAELDPCSICSSFIIDYAPANTTVYLDGMTERVTMQIGNGTPQPADHLVSGENGAIFEWPLFTCGLGYFVLVDVDVNTIVETALGVVNRE